MAGPGRRVVQSCLNCQTSVDSKSITKYSKPFSETDRVDLFRSFAEGLNLEESFQMQSSWDFSKEALPFCKSCLQFIRKLHDFKQELLRVQEGIRQLVLILRTKLLESMDDKRTPITIRKIPDREAEFRSLAASGYLPVVDVIRIETRSSQLFSRRSQNLNGKLISQDLDDDDNYEIGLSEFAEISKSPIDHDEFDFAQEHAIQLKVFQHQEEDPLKTDTDYLSGTTVVEDFVALPAPMLDDADGGSERLKSLRNSRHKKSTTKHYQKWLRSLPDGREFLQGVEVRTLNGNDFECGECNRIFHVKQYLVSHIKALHLGMRRGEPKSHPQRLTKLLRRFRSTATASAGSRKQNKKTNIRKPSRRPRSELVQPKLNKWIRPGEDGKEFIGDVELITLNKHSYQCGNCPHKTHCKAHLTEHIKFLHCGVKRRKPKKSAKEAAKKELLIPRWLDKREDGKQFVSGVEVIPQEGKKFQCGECPKICKSKTNLVIHIRRTHVPQISEPIRRKDGRYFIRDIELIPHEDEKGCWVCSRCNHKLRSKFNLGWHIRKVHFGHQWNRDQDMLVEPIKPPDQEEHLAAIKRTRTSDGREFYGKVEIKRLVNGDYSCTVCDRCFRSCPTLIRHIRCKHISELPGAVCDVCNMQFDAPSRMEQHRVSHFPEKLFICDQCGLGCKTKSSLNDHVRRVHDRLRKNICEICTKEFYTKKDLRKHLESHGIREYKFQCGHCPARFPFESFLRKHVADCDKVRTPGTVGVKGGPLPTTTTDSPETLSSTNCGIVPPLDSVINFSCAMTETDQPPVTPFL